jgi:type IV pilus assembly protein PilB
MSSPRAKLGDLLVLSGLITPEQLERALDIQKKAHGESLGAVLLSQEAITEADLVRVLSKQLSIPYATREKGLLSPAREQGLERLVPEEIARRYGVLPLSRHLNSLTIALTDPMDLIVLDNLRKVTGCQINPIIAPRSDIAQGISELYGEGGMLREAVAASYQESEALSIEGHVEEELSLDDLVSSAEKPPVVKLTDLLIRQAIKQRASDIHIEPLLHAISVRYRIDGVLHEVPPPEGRMLLPLVSRIKILSKMDIAEKRLPQDGSFRATIENRLIDFRVSTIPTLHGEKVVLRILDRSAVALDLETLGFEPEELELFRSVIRRPYGMILLTGPTGSGKTTTLYAALNEIKSIEKNIVTIEDPVEYQIPGINQVQVKPAIGLTFASGLRAFLRQDPNVILVGETRDLETAQICVRAALTGHVVFSTLHTNDAPTAISRLIDIGVEPYFVTASLQMVVAQRLVRLLCQKCREPYAPDPLRLPKGLTVPPGAKLYRAVGCEACANTGYMGRGAIYEIMTMTEDLGRLCMDRATMHEIRRMANASGMTTLDQSGFKKVLAGVTTVEEILRVTMASGM